MPILIGLKQKLKEFTLRDVAKHLFVFCIYFLGVKLGLYLFFDLHSSPALIWPPVGIGIAAFFLGGYSMLLPIVLAQVLATVSSTSSSMEVIVGTSLAYTFQAYIAAYFLRRLGLDPEFRHTKDPAILFLVCCFATMIAPLFVTVNFMVRHTLDASALLTWSRAWAGGFSSAVILTPLLTSWASRSSTEETTKQYIEIFIALVVLGIANYLVFWTTDIVPLGVIVIFVIPAALMWFVLRFHPRWLTLALIVTSVIAITGSIVAHSSPTPLNLQLFADEVYISFLAALFLFFVVLVDERREAYKKLEQNNEELAHALQKISAEDSAKTEFIAILAHELRNPLAPIVSAHEWLKVQPQTPESMVAIESAQKHSMMIRRLLDDLLDIVRVSQKKFRLNQELVSAKEIISQSVESMADFLQERRHKLRVIHQDETVVVFGDPIRLKQIVINLLNNAGKYMEPGGLIELECRKVDDMLVIRVADQGRGISPETLPFIFEPFRQVGPITNIGTGLGIGLSLTRQLVEMHDGTIEAASPGLGKGSVFTVYLPLPAEASVSLLPQAPTTQPETPESMRVLIIDDNEAAVEGLQKLLRHLGHDVRGSYTGEDGIREAAQYAPNLILLDIGLPDIAGYDVARRLRASGYAGTIVALTGYGQSGDKEESRDAGFDHHLVKPVSISDILAVMVSMQKEG